MVTRGAGLPIRAEQGAGVPPFGVLFVGDANAFQDDMVDSTHPQAGTHGQASLARSEDNAVDDVHLDRPFFRWIVIRR